jgi:GET complex subunit GET2
LYLADTSDDVSPAPAATSEPAPAPAATAPAPSAHAADPDEVDISQHFYSPGRASQRIPADAAGAQPSLGDEQLRQMMLGFDRANPATSGPAPGGNPMAGAEDDPLMKMMAQMMGGGGPGGGGPSFPGMPSMPGMMPQQQAATPDPYTSLWRLLHALVALGLGLYVAILTPFTGTKVERERHALAHVAGADDEYEHRKRLFFWVFATAEAGLLTMRLFLDKSRAPPPGIVWTVVGFLPEPFKGYATVALRYGQIFSTVRADILACMFVLGVCSWWRA